MSSPYSGTLDLLQSPSMRCFGDHPMKKVSHKRVAEVHLWTQSLDVDIWANQDAIPSEQVAHRR